MDWDAARLFLALARGRTLGEAAMTLGVDTSTAVVRAFWRRLRPKP